MRRQTGVGKSRPLSTDADGCPTAYLLYNFDIEDSSLKKHHKDFLTETVLHILDANADHRVRLVGRASRSGPERLNERISRQRVEAVAAFLVRGGIDRGRIQTEFLGESAPLSAANEHEEDRSVEVHIQVARALDLLLEGAWRVRPTSILVESIRQALEPLATRAGRELHIYIGRGILTRSADLTLDFDPGGRETRPCGLLILGNEGGGQIFVGAHESLRVCSGQLGDPRDPGGVDYVSQLQHVFENGEPEFARFVAATCVHELAHLMAQMAHTSDPNNFMHSDGSRGANLARERRNLESMRRHWSGRKTFTAAQENQLVCAIRTGNFPGGMRIGGR